MSILISSLGTLGLALVADPGQDWPNWRGPAQTGASTAVGLPTTWSATENVRWKVALPAWGGATPIVQGEQIFILTPSPAPEPKDGEAAPGAPQEAGRQGRRGGGGGRHPGGDDMLLLCLSAADGKEVWRAKLDTGNALHRKGNHASPSPVTDGERVYTVTGNGTVSAHTLTGERVWQQSLVERYGAFGLMWGYASSPALCDGKVVVQVLHGFHTDEPSYLVAFDAVTGEPAWRVERPTDAPHESPDAYTTPLVLRRGERTQLVITGGDHVTGHDPATGAEVWRLGGLNPQRAGNYRIVASTLAVGDLVVAPTRVRPLTAFRIGVDGKPTAEPVAWRWDERGAPDVPSPTTDGTYLYMVDDGGMVTCIDLATGEAKWGPERTLEGTVSASPTLADGKLFVINEEGVTVVLRAGPKFEQLAVNELDGSYTLSTPVAVGDRLYLRTGTHLYCISLPAK